MGDGARNFHGPITSEDAGIQFGHSPANQFQRMARIILMRAPAPIPCASLDMLLLQTRSMPRFDRRINSSLHQPGRSSFSGYGDRGFRNNDSRSSRRAPS